MDTSYIKLYPNAKINLGLEIIRKRPDCYHEIETLFYPIPLIDELEIRKSDSFHIALEGIDYDGDPSENLVAKAYRLISSRKSISPVSVTLHKKIPVGAGLGGGSSDAAFMLRGLNDLFALNCSAEELAEYAAVLGSDCPFFIYNQPMFATGRGEVLEFSPVSLAGKWLVMVKPDIFVATSVAYAGVSPFVPDVNLRDLLNLPVENWRGKIFNRFEPSVFAKFPEIEVIKEQMYSLGAVYASMSGSGSTVYGIFNSDPGNLESHFDSCFYFKARI